MSDVSDSIQEAHRTLADAMMLLARVVHHVDPSASGDLLQAARSLTATHEQLSRISRACAAAAKEQDAGVAEVRSEARLHDSV